MSFDDYLYKLFNADYYYMIHRKIEIAEWKLGIYNPYSTIDYVDFEDNPHYIGWYTQITDRIRVYNAARRLGKPTFSKICFEYDIRNKKWEH
jgi:hypothetical protein